MTVTLNDIRDAIIDWINDITTREVVLMNSGQLPKPRNPYATLLVSSFNYLGIQDAELAQDGLTETVSSPMQLSLSMNLYGGNAMTDAIRLSRSLYASDRYADLWQIMGLGGIQQVQDLSALETGAIKSRALLQVTVYANIDEIFSSTFIEKQVIVLKEPSKDYTEDIKGEENPKAKAAICPV